MTCTNCGATIKVGGAFCPQCGTAVAGTTPLSLEQPAAQPPAQPPVVEPAPRPPVFERPATPPAPIQPPVMQPPAVPPPVTQPLPEQQWPTAPQQQPGWQQHPAQPYGDDWSGGGGGGQGSLLFFRVVAALAALGIGITSLVAATSSDPPSWIVKWFLLMPPTEGVNGYKTETIILIVVAAISLIAFLTRTAAAQALALMPALTLITIFVINIVKLDEPHQFTTYLLTQNICIATWVCLGLSLICAATVLWREASPARVFGAFGAGAVITGVTVAIIAASAPSFGDALGDSFGTGQVLSSGGASSSQYGDSFGNGDTNDGDTFGDGGGDVGLASDNSPGDCASEWTSELDVVTDDLHATICESPDGDDDLSLTGNEVGLVNLPATSDDGSTWTAESDDGYQYNVTPDEITVEDNGSVQENEYTSDSGETDGSSSDTQDASQPGMNAASRLAIQQMLLDFHNDVVDRNFRAAFNLLSPRVQQIQLDKYGYAKWRRAQASLSPYLEPAGLHVTMENYDPNTSVALVLVTGMGWTAPHYSCKQWRGLTWVSYVNGAWRYEPGFSITRARAREWRSHFNELLGGSCRPL